MKHDLAVVGLSVVAELSRCVVLHVQTSSKARPAPQSNARSNPIQKVAKRWRWINIGKHLYQKKKKRKKEKKKTIKNEIKLKIN